MKRHKLLIFLFAFSLGLTTFLNAENVNMKMAGADDSGKKLNTSIINKTISDLSTKGGGTLFFPSGTYLTGAIKLKSNITIELEAGAILRFSDNFDDYLPFVEMRHEGVLMKSFSPLFYAVGETNITIKGRGTIDGQGKKWWDEFYHVIQNMQNNDNGSINKYQTLWEKENNIKELYQNTNEDYRISLKRRFFRPPLFQPLHCKNILIEGVTIINSPFWTINPEFCENITVTGVTINNPISPNTDGINPSSCNNVHISNCHINVGDDCITLKSGRDKQAHQLNVPCENITITNCTMLAGHGGVVIGSEMSGDVRKVVISNCIFDGTDRGIRIKSTRGRGGCVEEINVNNIVMKNIKEEAIVLDLFYSKMPPEPVTERTPIFRQIHISNLTGTEVNRAIVIKGLEEMPISDISLSDIYIKSSTGFDVEKVKNLTVSNVKIDPSEGTAFLLNNAKNVVLNNLSSEATHASAPLINIVNSQEIFIQGCFPQAGSKSFLQLNGVNSDIILKNNYLKRLSQIIDETQKGETTNLIIE